MLKRGFDIVVSAMGLLLFAPLLVAIALVILLDDGPPVLFTHDRVGQRFTRIRVWKIRSMRPGTAEPTITVYGDPRVTRVGRFLRRTKLDELPQFWNVLRGDMSLVGPRPEIPEYVELYRQRYEKILSVRPGITDPASILFADEEQLLAAGPDPARLYREKVLRAKLDLADSYIASRSFLGDLKLLAQTFAVILGKRQLQAFNPKP